MRFLTQHWRGYLVREMSRLRSFILALGTLLLFGTAGVLFAQMEKIKGSQDSFAKCPPKVACSCDADDDLGGDNDGFTVVPHAGRVEAVCLPSPGECHADGRRFFV